VPLWRPPTATRSPHATSHKMERPSQATREKAPRARLADAALQKQKRRQGKAAAVGQKPSYPETDPVVSWQVTKETREGTFFRPRPWGFPRSHSTQKRTKIKGIAQSPSTIGKPVLLRSSSKARKFVTVTEPGADASSADSERRWQSEEIGPTDRRHKKAQRSALVRPKMEKLPTTPGSIHRRARKE
jgi:hypothetical protein